MIERFQLALETPVGFFLLVLLGILFLLLFVYGFFVLKRQCRDSYRHRNIAYFERAQAVAVGFSFKGQHHGNFFGRETYVQDEANHHYLCLIFPPELATPVACSRFSSFLHALEGGWPPLFAPYQFFDCNERVLAIQKGVLSSEGKALMPLTAYIKDKRFSVADREKVLLLIARALAKLHEAYTESGEHLYHGFILPSTIFIDIDASHRLSHLFIAETGFAFALQQERMCQRIQDLSKGKVAMEKYRREELLAAVVALAPEQREVGQLSDVGTAADFFAFGHLALLLFTGCRTGKSIKWEMIPSRWHPFIKRCLHDDPKLRPKDFNELGEWVEDPDVALTVCEGDLEYEVGGAIEGGIDIASLAVRMERIPVDEVVKKKSRRRGGEEVLSLPDCLAAGSLAMKMSRWEVAAGHYRAALEIETEHPEALLKLAVCVYELGDMKAAEQYLNAAKAKDPSATKSFQQHIAFRI